MIFRKPSKQSKPADHPYTNVPLIVDSGLARSGTTVLRNCIAAHPEIECRNQESNYLFWHLRGVNLFWQDSFNRMNLSLSEKDFWKMQREFLLNIVWPKAKKQVPAIATYSIMDPRSALCLSQAFPKVSICYILRNGIEVVASTLAFENLKHLSFEQVCQNWALQVEMAKYCDDNHHATLIRHEWLKNDLPRFEEQFQQCLSVVGLEPDPKCLKPLQQNFHPTKIDGESKSDADDRDQRRNRWKFWTSEQKRHFEQSCGAAMEFLGYEIPW